MHKVRHMITRVCVTPTSTPPVIPNIKRLWKGLQIGTHNTYFTSSQGISYMTKLPPKISGIILTDQSTRSLIRVKEGDKPDFAKWHRFINTSKVTTKTQLPYSTGRRIVTDSYTKNIGGSNFKYLQFCSVLQKRINKLSLAQVDSPW